MVGAPSRAARRRWVHLSGDCRSQFFTVVMGTTVAIGADLRFKVRCLSVSSLLGPGLRLWSPFPSVPRADELPSLNQGRTTAHMTDTPQIRLEWTAERVVRLKRLWLVEGLSASVCAAILGGTTRNAVIAKLHRMGLSKRGHGTRSSYGLRAKRIAPNIPPDGAIKRPHLEFFPAAVKPANGKKLKTLAQLGDFDCRYGYGHVGEKGFGFCGEPQFPGLPYCDEHAAVCFQAPQGGAQIHVSIASDASAPQKEEVA